MAKNSKSSRSKESDSLNYKNILIGSVLGSVLFFVLISLFSLMLLKSEILSASFYMSSGLISGAVSGFIGGFAAVRPVKKNGAAAGAISGLVQALICSAAVFFINDNNSGTGIFILMGLIIAASAAGGISAVNLKIKKRY